MPPARPLGAVLAAVLLAGCGGSSHHAPTPTPTPRATEVAVGPRPALTDLHTCEGTDCYYLPVPLDHSGHTPGTLRLQVAVEGPPHAPVVVLLTGGPGQNGVTFVNRLPEWLGPRSGNLRVVALDQRGTGDDALNCPALQHQMGSSDLAPPTQAAVQACARAVGAKRRYFTTADTVADLDALRVALGVRKFTLDGVSYGTYVAERYALAHPAAVSKLVLDSVVPQDGISLLSTTPLEATARVLGPAATADLATVVRRDHDGPQLLDMLTSLSVGAPHLTTAVRDLQLAAGGHAARLDRLARNVHRYDVSSTAQDLSQGLHASTLCGDLSAPWGGPSAPMGPRKDALERAVAQLTPDELGPYDRATAAGNGIALQCEYWPPEPVSLPTAGGDLPKVPVLILAGTKDLSTPLEWARAERAKAPDGTLMIVPGAGHSVQSQGSPAVRAALLKFLGV